MAAAPPQVSQALAQAAPTKTVTPQQIKQSNVCLNIGDLQLAFSVEEELFGILFLCVPYLIAQ